MREYCGYLLSNGARNLYIGVTSNLEKRLWEHRNGIHPASFSSRYNLDKVVFAEVFPTSLEMIAFEKQIKGWTRAKKLKLILSRNPTWSDLGTRWTRVADPSTPPHASMRSAQEDALEKVRCGPKTSQGLSDPADPSTPPHASVRSAQEDSTWNRAPSPKSADTTQPQRTRSPSIISPRIVILSEVEGSATPLGTLTNSLPQE